MRPTAAMPWQACTLEQREPGADDEYGDPVMVTTAVETQAIVWELTTTEQQSLGLAVSAGWKAILPAGTAVGPHDALVIGGVSYEVDGDPWPVVWPGRDIGHVECRLRRVS